MERGQNIFMTVNSNRYLKYQNKEVNSVHIPLISRQLLSSIFTTEFTHSTVSMFLIALLPLFCSSCLLAIYLTKEKGTA